MVAEYAVYEGDTFLVMGTAKECAIWLGVTPKYIQWLTYPAARKRFESRVDKSKCMTAIKLEDDDFE